MNNRSRGFPAAALRNGGQQNMMKITDDIHYIGVNDHEIDLFEGQYVVENGMAYNSYVITDDKTAVMDTVDAHFREEWLANLEQAPPTT